MAAAETSLSIPGEINYEKLNRLQKLALFLITVGPEQAAAILKGFDEIEVEQICREISNFPMVSDTIQQKVMEDFSSIITQSLGSVLGGSRFAHRTLEMAKGDYKAANMIGRIVPLGNSSEVMHDIAEMDARQLFNLLRFEQPQTIACVLSFLNADKSGAILMMVPADERAEVVERMGTMNTTSLENISKVVHLIRRHVNAKDATSLQQSGGVRSVADLLNRINKDIGKSLLNKISERNPALGQAIQRKMFSFDDLINLTTRDLQRVMREVDSQDMIIALKSANEGLQNALFGAVSKRAAGTLKEEMEMLGPIRLKEMEAAQDRIIQVVRQLEEEGEITLDQEGSDVVM